MSEEELACWKEDVPQFDLNSETVHHRAARGRGKPFLPWLVRVDALGEGFGSKSAALCMICGSFTNQCALLTGARMGSLWSWAKGAVVHRCSWLTIECNLPGTSRASLASSGTSGAVSLVSW